MIQPQAAVFFSLSVWPLVLLGQSSLQVFCAQFFCFLGIGMMGNADRIFDWRQFALVAVTFASLLLAAKIFAKRELAAPVFIGRESFTPFLTRPASPDSELTAAVARVRLPVQ
jgi:hypothetical protein